VFDPVSDVLTMRSFTAPPARHHHDPTATIDTRWLGVHHLAAGVEALERRVLLDAQASGMTWAEIGDVYGVSRQAAHRKFSDETVVPADFFDTLVADLDADAEVIPTLAQAAKRARHAADTR
jgi:hypothetical protein